MLLIFATPEEARELLGLSTRQPEILRPQTSGPCVHYDERSEHAADTDPCTYPYDDGRCPHLDTPEILCPLKGTCAAMQEIARMRDKCETEQEGPDLAMVADDGRLYTYTVEPEPEVPALEPDEEVSYAPTRRRHPAWTADEIASVAAADSQSQAVADFRAQFPDSVRSDAAIKTQWWKQRSLGRQRPPEVPAPTPDFVGDTVPVTQCEEADSDGVDPEPTPGKGLYGDARALHADLMDSMMCDRPLAPEPETAPENPERESTLHPWIGTRVRVLDPQSGLRGRTGIVQQYILDPREMLVALDDSLDQIWLPPESLLVIGAGRRSP